MAKNEISTLLYIIAVIYTIVAYITTNIMFPVALGFQGSDIVIVGLVIGALIVGMLLAIFKVKEGHKTSDITNERVFIPDARVYGVFCALGILAIAFLLLVLLNDPEVLAENVALTMLAFYSGSAAITFFAGIAYIPK